MTPTLVVLVSVIGLGLCAPNHLKTVVIETDKNAGAGAAAGGLGASASWAGFSASAGLGGLAGAGAGAKADAGVATGASAGTGGVLLTDGVAAGGVVKTVHTGPSFFDRIFNIPISILQSVNHHLNSRGGVGVTKAVVIGGGGGVQPGVVAGDHAGAGVNAGAGVSAGAGINAGAAVGGSGQQEGTIVVTKSLHHPHRSVVGGGGGGLAAGAVVVGQKGPANYDSVFNIPISALRSVNQLLNGK